MDIEGTKSYYEQISNRYLCDCAYCQNYVREIKVTYPKVAEYLCSLGIDIEKPFETMPLEPDEAGYTASAQGNNGPVAVTVEFSENEILSVVVGEHAETPGISDAPISRIPEAIVSEQTLDVDTVSGATHTSEAILTAVADCVAQAGGNVEALKTKQSGKDEAMKEVTLEVDVVVAGSGISGMCAAISAAEEGANVLLLEKQGVIGGSAGTSGGGFIVVNSHFEKEAGIEDNRYCL